jgi:ubiquinone/menaquinone biosynthesis C-methylase UbiE
MDAFFQRFFPNDINALHGYHQVIERHLTDSQVLLDLGCGDNTQLARYRSSRRQVWGADIHRHPQLNHAEWFRPLEADGRLPFPDASFDLVTACWVLEHVAAPNSFVSEIARVLRPGGSFIGITINGAHYVTWLIRLIHLLPHLFTQRLVKRLYGRPHHDTFPTYYRLNTATAMKPIVEKAGLELTSTTYFANPDYFSFSKGLRRLAIVVDWFLEQWFAGLGRLYVVTVLRNPNVGEACVKHAA